eukprot:CAMPEP_0198142246 /NCGR_PEP_ID=MMETSP1443-20131203/5090_1 /TAXON_ID=186043 /ORGANISM="Entomoneis sp., Strain CCMP2396" /LENGTH=560 /DNA_ID=CAMNT_0043805215 /DNA_START=40 /DNA_END=1722 /DNA_ORIENTATION=+
MTVSSRITATSLALLLVFFSRCEGSGSFKAIGNYHPKNDVAYLSAIASDLKAIDMLLLSEREDGFALARDIYENGGYSAPHALLNVVDGIPYNIPDGAVLTGTSLNGNPTTVTVLNGPYLKGDSPIRVEHSNTAKSICQRASLPNAVTDACLVEGGTLSWSGHTKTISYLYSTTTDIKSDHNIRNFSVNAKSKFKVNGNSNVGYYKDFQKFFDYFGTPDFADQIAVGAFEGNIVEFTQPGLRLDFTEFSFLARRSVIIHTCAYLIIGLFAIRELEAGLSHCDHRCGDSGCNPESIHALDGAVAFYTGDVYHETGKGNLMYGLAQNMCKEFRTCGKYATEAQGEAKVNFDIFLEFNSMQKNFDSSHCLEAKMSKEVIAHEIFAPLFQASLLALHMDKLQNTTETKAESLIFTTILLPLLRHCDIQVAKEIAYLIADRSAEDDTFSIIKIGFEENYRCVGMGCLNVGGIWDPLTNTYVEGAESCYVPAPKADSPKMNPFHGILTGLAFLFVVGIIGYFVKKRRDRYLKRKKRARAVFNEHDMEDDSDSDDSSLGGSEIGELT